MNVISRWTDDDKETVRTLWKQGRSATEIAPLIRKGLTRNAVLGVLHRMGLLDGSRSRAKVMKPVEPASPVEPKPAAAIAKPVPSRAAGASSQPRPPSHLKDSIVDAVPLHQRKTILTLEAQDCKWPIGDPRHADFHFCAAKKMPTGPYCEHHARQAFEPVKVKRAPHQDYRTPAAVAAVRRAKEFA